jgi:AAA domain, putative AbiEii toxin, Type IV TA system/AAA ATPase domain
MSDLLINSLEITGYRTFRHLEIPKLGRVNLIVGKNNVGKSALLEALKIYADRGSLRTIYSFQRARDEVADLYSSRGRLYQNQGYAAPDVKNLFHGRPDFRVFKPVFTVLANNKPVDQLSIAISKAYVTPSLFPEDETQLLLPNFDAEHLEVTIGSSRIILAELHSLFDPRVIDRIGVEPLPAQFVPANGMLPNKISDLWDQLALTAAEDLIVESLKVILPDVERLNFLAKDDREKSRIPYVKIKGIAEPIQIRNMGEGMYRLLGLSIALASAQQGILLVDEIETGFHYSILPKVWRLIFETATKLNVQVFATTHSWDCIESFQQAAAKHPEDGMLVRLENREGEMKVTTFDEKRLAIVTRERIEVR